VQKNRTSAAEARRFLLRFGTTKVVPFKKAIYETSSSSKNYKDRIAEPQRREPQKVREWTEGKTHASSDDRQARRQERSFRLGGIFIERILDFGRDAGQEFQVPSD
jgi:hypothetical protein